MNIEELKKEYWNYLTTEVIKAINNADDSNIKYLNLMKYDLLVNLNLMLQSEEKFNSIVNERRSIECLKKKK